MALRNLVHMWDSSLELNQKMIEMAEKAIHAARRAGATESIAHWEEFHLAGVAMLASTKRLVAAAKAITDKDEDCF